MTDYSHHISGFFANHDDAQNTFETLVKRGLPSEQLQIFETGQPTSAPVPTQDSNAVLKDVLVDGSIGTAVGTGLGALAEVALVAANVTLFIASPLIAPLAMLGWGASIGALIGGTAGAIHSSAPKPKEKEGWLSSLVSDAIANGQIVLMVQARTDQETVIAREVIQAAVGDYKDIRIS